MAPVQEVSRTTDCLRLLADGCHNILCEWAGRSALAWRLAMTRDELAREMPIAAIDVWAEGIHDKKFTLDVYLQDPGAIHAEARRQEQQYGYVVWDSIQEILDWESTHGSATEDAS